MSDEPIRPKPSFLRVLIVGLLAGVIAASASIAWKKLRDGGDQFIGSTPPDFPANGSWFNAEPPYQLADLRGKVVLLQFSFLGCQPCRMMDPFFHKWHEQYRKDGPVVIEVDDGDTDRFATIKNWVAEKKIDFPVYYDTDGELTNAYRVTSFPTRFLIGREGKVLWQDKGWGGDAGVARIEAEIKKALGNP